jgi:ABC-type branched-subunit amino acid transport system permease subunit
VTDPLATVDPPAPAPIAKVRPPWITTGTRVFGLVVTGIGLWLALDVVDGYWRGLVVSGVLLGIIMLSLTVVTGIGGMISLSQAALAAIGGFTTAQLVDATGMPVLAAVTIGGVVTAAVGAVLAVPVVRLDGVYLALATLAFALMFQSVLVPLSWVSGGTTPLNVPRPTVGSIDLADDRWFLLLACIFLAVAAVVVIRIREGTTGRFLRAVETSPMAAASIGISATRARIVAFTVGAAIAGVGGGLVVTWTGQASYDRSFQFFYGLVWVALVVSAGARSVQAAILSGLGFFLVPAALERLLGFPGNWAASNADAPEWLRSLADRVKPSWSLSLAFILFGLGAITYARHPEGTIEAQSSKAVSGVVRRVERWRQRAGTAAVRTP